MTPIHELSSARPLTFPAPAARPAATPAAAEDRSPSPFARLVRGLAREADDGETAMRGVVAAGAGHVPLDPASLLALQAGIYRYGEAMDLAALLVDKASTGVKTVVQGTT
jgi:hypothetical protein